MSKLKIKRGDSITYILFEGTPALAHILHQNGLMIQTPCGGKGVCGKCRIHAEGSLSVLTENELQSLSPTEIANGLRLVCQTVLKGDASVWIANTSELVNIQLEGTLPAFPLHPMQGKYGLAVDIGTTTLALRLVDLEQCQMLKAESAVNPQGTVAADVIGRIEASLSGKSGRLQELVIGAIEKSLEILCKSCAVFPYEIGPVVMAGNTTMLYLLTNRNPVTLSRAPFLADCLFGFWMNGSSLGLHSMPNAKICLPACVSAFVGADITCGVLASRIYKREKTSLLVDLGTNGEIALWHGRTLYCCATAAGPAFEGGNIHRGVGSVLGAIDSVWVQDGKLSHTTLGGHKPVGICGSGLIDAVASLLELGLIDETGLMEKGEVSISEEVRLTQKDIRSVQLAKGAIAAGIKTICQYVGISLSQIETLYIAGGFGSHVSIANAANIGLIPRELKKKTIVLGNASLTGAVMLLMNQHYVQDAAEIAENAVSVPLGGSAIFAEHYMECMMFVSFHDETGTSSEK